jgi:peptidoglycan-associated lipoprotein
MEGSDMSRNTPLLGMLLVLCLAITVSGCKKKAPETTVPDEPPATQTQPRTQEPAEPKVEVEDSGFGEQGAEEQELPRMTRSQLDQAMQTVYFGFDQYDLTEETRRVLQGNANVLQENRDFKVVIEGHCDERGTIDYNLALGEKRARAVRDYLVSLGLSPSRLRIVSYGEERPADPGHGESAWAKNRRAEFRAEQ